eukprot:GHRR01023091.1.p1 GENE.GHRR01023091.1~~GHRR01023091.1.p1  ORF type:complete len:367 (+),score=82.02 GHRR01023091.1:3052-4152(+)
MQQQHPLKRPFKRTLRARVTTFLAVLLVLYVGYIYYWHHQVLLQRSASSCSARLTALGLGLPAVTQDHGYFATSASASSTSWQHSLVRQHAYQHMAADMKQRGLQLGGEVTQGLKQQDLFQHVPAAGKWGRPHVKALLHPLKVPVRAVVLPLLDHEAAMMIHTSVRHALHSLLTEDSIWWQDELLMHATLYHASTHAAPVPMAGPSEVLQEVSAVTSAMQEACPITAVLDRVVVSASGAVVACWQVLPGSGEPAILRDRLRAALPRAPPLDKQVIQELAILHTTVGRVLAPTKRPMREMQDGQSQVWNLQALASALGEAVSNVSDELCGLVAAFDEAWYVEESDILALALGGTFVKHPGKLKCPVV